MPRLVKKTAHAPEMVGDKKICMCGLSKNQPFCDKSHLLTIGEDDKKLYYYENGKREEVAEEDEDCSCGECESECKEGKCEDGCCDKSDKDCCGGDCCKNEEETEE